MPPPTPAQLRARDRYFDSMPDPRRQILTIDEMRRNEAIHERFAPSFRHLESPAPSPMVGERPADFERRLVGELTTEASYHLARTANRTGRRLSADECDLVRNVDMVKPRVLGVLGPTAIDAIAATAARVAAALAADHGQGSFSRPGETRIVEENVNGHRVRSYYGDSVEFITPFLHSAQCVVGGQLSRPLADVAAEVARQPRPQYYPPPPPSLGPQPDLMTMITTAVAAALPQRLGSRK